MSQTTPLISVVMPVRNAGPFLDESIRSILNQTFTDFEFVILDDVSTDGSEKLLHEWERKDTRIRIFRTEQPLGLSRSSPTYVNDKLKFIGHQAVAIRTVVANVRQRQTEVYRTSSSGRSHSYRQRTSTIKDLKLAVHFIDDLCFVVRTRPPHVPQLGVGYLSGFSAGDLGGVKVEVSIAIRVEIDRVANPHRSTGRTWALGDSLRRMGFQIEEIKLVSLPPP